jgi:two-component system, cell cycle sensor histidine kinase and response regulator CckA
MKPPPVDMRDVRVTTKLPVQDAAREGEEKFSRVFERAPVMMSLSDLTTGRFTEVNDEAIRISGFTREEIVGANAVDIGWISSEDRSRIVELIRQHGRVSGLELTARSKAGAPIDCYYFAELVTLGGVPHILSITQDVTSRNLAERTIRESERRYRDVIERAPVAIAIARDERIYYANRAYADMFGVADPQLMVGEPVQKRIAPEFRERYVERATRRLQGLPVEGTYETAGLKDDGSSFPIVASVSMLTLADGPAAIGFFQDVSAQRSSERRLRDSEAKFRAIVENSLDGIVFADAHATIQYRSPSYLRINGYSDEERVGQDGMNTVHPDDQATVRRAWAEVIAHPDRTGHAQYRIRHKDGTWRFIETSVKNLLANPHVGSVVVTSRDVTERVKSEAERRKLQEELLQAQKLEAVGRLAGGVAHDFNNMLGIILTGSDMALRALEEGHPARADLFEVQRAAERSATLTRQLLTFARQQTAVPEVFNLNVVVQDALSMLRRLIGEKIALVWASRAPRASIKADRTQLEQVLTNLTVNARDAIGDTGTITVETRLTDVDQPFCDLHPGAVPGRYVSLSIADTGCGMHGDTLAHIFEPFFSTKGVGVGTGLGLATVYGIVKQSGGFIEVTSQVGLGTTFTVHLPLCADRSPVVARVEQEAELPRGGETVLVVEDEPMLLKLTERLLKELGYTVLAAGTPADAIQLGQEHGHGIDLLLTDVILPEMNGRDLARQLQSDAPHLKCVFMSGYTADLIADHGVLHDGVDFLQKPWSNRDLAGKLRQVLDRG